MFEAEEREALAEQIRSRARQDPNISACGHVGSVARGEQDAWSDIDIALGLTQGCDLETVAQEWTDWLISVADVVDTLDVSATSALYRVFLLATSLQIDLSFWPPGTLRSTGAPIKTVFGELQEADAPTYPDPVQLVRLGWLYALHARSAIARGRVWQAEMMLADLRHQVISLSCLRLGLDPSGGRGAHLLPDELSALLQDSRATTLVVAEQARSLRATLALYQAEVARHDPARARVLVPALTALVTSEASGHPDRGA